MRSPAKSSCVLYSSFAVRRHVNERGNNTTVRFGVIDPVGKHAVGAGRPATYSVFWIRTTLLTTCPCEGVSLARARLYRVGGDLAGELQHCRACRALLNWESSVGKVLDVCAGAPQKNKGSTIMGSVQSALKHSQKNFLGRFRRLR